MSRSARLAAVLAAVVVVAVLVGAVAVALLAGGEETVAPTPGASAPTAAVAADCAPVEPQQLDVEVVRTVPHDPTAYTQGLVVSAGRLFESTGREGDSTVREVDLDTGRVIDSSPLAPDEFGEGLTTTDDGQLVQLTWLSGVAHRWDVDTLEPRGDARYDGEGWGLSTLDDGTLVMTDGSDVLTLRDPEDFSEVDARTVQRVGGDADRLNELEWDGEWLWANRYQTDELLRIDPECATVTGVADLSALRDDATQVANRDGTPIDVANGIAHLPGTDRYLLTGKWWPTMYEVRIS